MHTYLLLEGLSAIVGLVALIYVMVFLIRRTNSGAIIKNKHFYIPCSIFILAFFGGLLGNRSYAPDFAMPAFMHSEAMGGMPPSIPFPKIFEFFENENRFEKVADIGRDPNDVPHVAQKPDTDGIVRIHLTAKEVIAEIAPDIYFNYWTYNGTVPGPMLRITEGDTVELSLSNDSTSLHHHNIDLHAVSGPGGGATLTDVAPGETKTFRFKAMNPGLYVYHCAMPNVSTHNSHGQYGLILVEPKEGLPKVDKEFYVMQGELYTMGQLGKRGLVPFDSDTLLSGNPNYVTFNGKVEQAPRMYANPGETVRMYVGNGGVNLISSFHIIGAIFDTVYPEGAMGSRSSLFKNVQTTIVPAGGSAIVDFSPKVPGKYIIVDHALARMNKGAWAVLQVAGENRPDIFGPVK